MNNERQGGEYQVNDVGTPVNEPNISLALNQIFNYWGKADLKKSGISSHISIGLNAL